MANKTKIYFWLKLDNNFFKNLAVRALRKRAGGDTYLVIYQRLLLEALESNGTIEYQGLLEDLPSELAITLDEKEEDVRTTIEYFKQVGLIQIGDDGSAFFEQVPMLIDQETNWNRYKRNAQKNKKLEKFQPPSNHLPTEIEIEIEKETEIETEIEIETEKETDLQTDKDLNVSQSVGRPIGWSGIQSYLESQNLALSPKQIGELEDFMEIDGLEKSLIEKAIDIAAGETGSKRSYKYLKGILTNWKNGNIKTVADQEANEAEREKTPKRIFKNKRLQEKWDNYDDSNDLF